MARNALRIDPEIIRNQIETLSREPFRESLSRLLQAEPSIKIMRAFAEKYPDRFWQAVTQAAKLSGYTEKRIIEHNFYAQTIQMSDAELYAELREKELELQKLLALEGKAVEG